MKKRGQTKSFNKTDSCKKKGKRQYAKASRQEAKKFTKFDLENIKLKIQTAIVLADGKATPNSLCGLFDDKNYNLTLREMILSGEVTLDASWKLNVTIENMGKIK